MIKVILNAPEGQEIRLIPEQTTVREVLGQFHADCEGRVFAANGSFLQAEDMDRKLVEIVRDDEVRITSVPNPVEVKIEPFGCSMKKLSSEEAKVYEALIKARAALDEAIDMLGTPVKDDELPF